MPFKAKIDGETVISVDMTDEEWNELKKIVLSHKNTIELPCCGSLANPRVSKLKTKHFVHKAKTPSCNWKPESAEHLWVKEIIFKTCKEEGWYVEPEYSFNDWAADVFATDGNVKIAFEVQWSRQTEEETRRRQQNYKKDNIKGVWLFRHIPESLIAKREIPAFSLAKKDGGYSVKLGHNELELNFAVRQLLWGNVEFRGSIICKRNQLADVYKFEMECWRCKKKTPVIGVNSVYLSCCGYEFYNMSLSDEDLGIAIAALQKEGIKELAGLAPIKRRYSKTMGCPYWSNGCKWCGAIVGAWFLNHSTLDYLCTNPKAAPILKVPFILNARKSEVYPHWCLKGEEGFCGD